MPLGAFSAMFFGPYWCIRPSNIGTFPPAWVKMKRMSLNLENVPVKSRFVTARAVSCGISTNIGETSGGQPDRGFNCLHLAKERANIVEFKLTPVLEKCRGFRSYKPVGRI